MVIIVLSLNNLLYKMLIRLKIVFTFFCVLSAGLVHGQSEAILAEEYYKAGEFEKAANEYRKLLKGDVTWARLSRYVTSLQKINKGEEAVKFLRRQQRSD
ncbi:hypothetical protein LC612_43400, partial [Nostoc sp. CHAB 5834]|nr:hypothetical protein [Nostoc sp. CHAB 5834]